MFFTPLCGVITGLLKLQFVTNKQLQFAIGKQSFTTRHLKYLYFLVPDLCKRNPCENGGICVQVGSDYKCICAYGYKGVNCHRKYES